MVTNVFAVNVYEINKTKIPTVTQMGFGISAISRVIPGTTGTTGVNSTLQLRDGNSFGIYETVSQLQALVNV